MNIYITSDASLELWTYVRAVGTEIGGFGYAWFQEDGSVVWDKTFLVPQIVSHSEVDFDSTGGDAYAIEKAATDGVLDKDNFVWVSWHSHHTMQAFWSKTDDKRIESLGMTGVPHLLSFVGCHDLKYRIRYDGFNINHGGVTIPQVTMDDLALFNDPTDAKFYAIYSDVRDCLKERPKVKAVTKQVTKPKRKQLAPVDNGQPRLTIDEALEAADLVDNYDMSERDAIEAATWGKLTKNNGQLAWTDDEYDFAADMADAIAGGAQ